MRCRGRMGPSGLGGETLGQLTGGVLLSCALFNCAAIVTLLRSGKPPGFSGVRSNTYPTELPPKMISTQPQTAA